jgi:transposase
MKDVDLYQQLLGLCGPWKVQDVGLDLKRQSVVVRVSCDSSQVWSCPKCTHRATIHDWTERVWRHLDTCQMRTQIEARVPRVRCTNEECPERGTITVQVPWAEGSSRFSAQFECFAIRLLNECSLSGAAEILRISWDEVDGIMDRAVKRGRRRKAAAPSTVTQVCIDEKAAGRGHDYVTVVAAIHSAGSATVEYVTDGREEASLNSYWQSRTPAQLAALEGVGMDMWRPYFNSTMNLVPRAGEIITFDRFHIMQKVTVVLNEVRRAEQAAGAQHLKGTRMDWLTSEENLTPDAREHVMNLCSKCRTTGRAYAMKEALRQFWSCQDAAEGKAFLRWWTGWAQRCRIPPMAKAGEMLKRHAGGMLAWFKTRLSNGAIEGLNNKIQSLVKRAYGFRNKERLKTAIYFHCGGLNLYPGTRGGAQ